MTKVALCFFGQPRFVDREEIRDSYYKNIIDRYDTDVYAHAWYSSEGDYEFSSWSNLSHHSVPDGALETIAKFYKPSILVHDKPMQFQLPRHVQEYVDGRFSGGHWNARNYSNLMSQLYSIQRVSDYLYLKSQITTVIKYDFIVLARYDTLLYNFPDLEELNSQKFYVPNTHGGLPDMIKVYGPKFLPWARNVYFDINGSYEGIREPTPEEFKRIAFLRRFSEDDIERIPMSAIAVRNL